MSDIDRHSDSDASEEVDEVGRSEHLTDGEPVEKKSKCKHATFKQKWLLTWPGLVMIDIEKL